MKVALVYDRVNKWGGAERVLLALHELFPDAPLFTAVYNSITANWASVFKVHTSFLQYFPKATSAHELYGWLMPLAFESFNFDEFDVVISVTSEAAKGVITKPGTVHICYCLTPTRYLWSGYKEYFSNLFFRFVTKPIVWYLRRWDIIAATRPDVMIGISKEVQNRVRKYYNRDVALIYPPVSLVTGSKQETNEAKGYFLVVSRLVQYKRIDIAIEACNRLKLQLRIIGNGSQKSKLQSLAGPTITFLGNLTDEELVEYYKNCRAMLFPGIEDFGLTIIEAQNFGKPVIAHKAGGAMETIIEGKTGTFFSPQTVNALIEVLKGFDEKKFNVQHMQKHAAYFGQKRFVEDWKHLLDKLKKK